jgi:hypothetical protein
LYTIIMKYDQFMSPQLIEYKKVIMDKFTWFLDLPVV